MMPAFVRPLRQGPAEITVDRRSPKSAVPEVVTSLSSVKDGHARGIRVGLPRDARRRKACERCWNLQRRIGCVLPRVYSVGVSPVVRCSSGDVPTGDAIA